MSKRQILAVLGIWVMIFSWLNFPPNWKPWIGVVTGLLIILAAYRKTQKSKMSASNSSFVESTPTTSQNNQQPGA
jgi:hypothetical protein